MNKIPPAMQRFTYTPHMLGFEVFGHVVIVGRYHKWILNFSREQEFIHIDIGPFCITFDWP